MGEIDHLVQRVDRLEEDVKPLSGLPDKLDLLIALQRESNKKMDETFVTKDVLELKLQNVSTTLKLWIIGAITSGIFSFILFLIQLYKVFH